MRAKKAKDTRTVMNVPVCIRQDGPDWRITVPPVYLVSDEFRLLRTVKDVREHLKTNYLLAPTVRLVADPE